MKTYINTKMAKILMILGGSCCLFTSSCAMSKGEAQKRGEAAGTVSGAIAGVMVAKNNGGGLGDIITGGLVGAGLGNAVGGEAGRRSSKLDVEHVKAKR